MKTVRRLAPRLSKFVAKSERRAASICVKIYRTNINQQKCLRDLAFTEVMRLSSMERRRIAAFAVHVDLSRRSNTNANQTCRQAKSLREDDRIDILDLCKDRCQMSYVQHAFRKCLLDQALALIKSPHGLETAQCLHSTGCWRIIDLIEAYVSYCLKRFMPSLLIRCHPVDICLRGATDHL